MRDALSILERCSQGEENNITEEKVKDLVGIPKLEYISGMCKAILEYDVDKSLEISNEIILEGKDLGNFLWEIIKYVKDLMILKTANSISNIYSVSDKEVLQKLSEISTKDRLLDIIYKLSDLENELKWSSQKNIIFQVGIMRLCSKENSTLEERVKNIENKIASGNINVKVENNTSKKQSIEQSTISRQNVDNNMKKNNISEKKSENFWDNVINKLKEERKAMIYSNLNNTRAVLLDDMTVGIEFLNGLSSFGRAVIEKPENMNEIKKLVSIECGKDMRIKIIDVKENKENDNSNNENLNIGIDVNYIE